MRVVHGVAACLALAAVLHLAPAARAQEARFHLVDSRTGTAVSAALLETWQWIAG